MVLLTTLRLGFNSLWFIGIFIFLVQQGSWACGWGLQIESGLCCSTSTTFTCTWRVRRRVFTKRLCFKQWSCKCCWVCYGKNLLHMFFVIASLVLCTFFRMLIVCILFWMQAAQAFTERLEVQDKSSEVKLNCVFCVTVWCCKCVIDFDLSS